MKYNWIKFLNEKLKGSLLNKKAGIMMLGILVAVLIALKVSVPQDVGEVEENKYEEINTEEKENEMVEVEMLPTTTLIRVLIKTNGFEQLTHSKIQVMVSGGIKIVCNGREEVLQGGQIIEILPDDSRFEDGNIILEPVLEEEQIQIHSIQRSAGIPAYSGKVELFSTQEGIVIINELDLEEYLKGVLPSEMPSYFEKEALKAQAVCARSYAYNHMTSYGYPEYSAHVDDSTSYQVYNNLVASEAGNTAIEETKNEKLGYQGTVITTYFFSTSSGHTTDLMAWGTPMTEDNSYLKGISVAEGEHSYEAHLPWYAWSITLSRKELENLLELNTRTEIGNLQTLEVTKRGTGEVALEIKAVGDSGEIIVQTENKIRRALGSTNYSIQKNDGSVVSGTTLLPSAFFEVEMTGDIFTLNGGGYGHGIGMSQNGANEMAKMGKTYEEILYAFYQGTEIVE